MQFKKLSELDCGENLQLVQSLLFLAWGDESSYRVVPRERSESRSQLGKAHLHEDRCYWLILITDSLEHALTVPAVN